MYGESEGAEIVTRLAHDIKRVTDIMITHRGMGMSNMDERNSSHRINFISNGKIDPESIKLTQLANGFNFPSEKIILNRKVRNWVEFFSIKTPPIQSLYSSNKRVFIYLGKKDTTSPFDGLLLSKKYFCSRGSKKLTTVTDEKAKHQMPFFSKAFAHLKNTIEQWIINPPDKHLNLSYPIKEIDC